MQNNDTRPSMELLAAEKATKVAGNGLKVLRRVENEYKYTEDNNVARSMMLGLYKKINKVFAAEVQEFDAAQKTKALL
jgi:hypothetical protein